GELYQAQESRLGRQRAKEPARLAILARNRTLPEQPAFWTGPAPSVGLTVADRAGSRMDPQRDDLFAQGTTATVTPLHRLPRRFRLVCSERLGSVARRRTGVLRLTASAHGRFGGFSGRLNHVCRQPDTKVVCDRTDIGNLPLIQRPQEAGDPVARIGEHR